MNSNASRRPRHSQSKKRNRNPFRYLRPVPPEEFLGRWPMVKEIALDLTLDEGDSHACIGGRRFGKSSLLAALHYHLRQPEAQGGDYIVLPILIDIKEGFASEERFFAHLLYEVRRRVDREIHTAPADPSPVRVELDNEWLNSLFKDDSSELSFTGFKEALDYILDQLYQADGPTRFVFLLDEVEDVLSYPWHQSLFNRLRSLIYAGDLADNIRLVLSGSRRFLDEVSDRGSPLWNVLKLNYLAVFDEPSTYELISRADNLSEEAKKAVWLESGGHPFLAQYLLYYLWQGGLEQANKTTVTEIVNRFLHEEQAHLDGWAKALEEIGLQVYGYFVNQEDWFDEDQLFKGLTAEPNLIKRGLVALSYHGYITHDGSWNRYHRTGNLFYRWYLSRTGSMEHPATIVASGAKPVGDTNTTVCLLSKESKNTNSSTEPDNRASRTADQSKLSIEERKMTHFFVSYNGKDKAWAEWIAWQLEEAGYTTVIQAWDFRPGGNFVIDMQKAAAGAERTIAVLSQNYLDALYTQPEWAAAFKQDPTGEKKTLLPVRVQECELTGLLSQIVYIDFVGKSEAEGREALLAGLKVGRAKPSTAPGFPGSKLAVTHTQSEKPSFPPEEIDPVRMNSQPASAPVSPSLPRFKQVKLKALEDRLETLTKQYEAANGQLNSTLAATDKVTIGQQIKGLEQEIQAVEDEINQLKSSK